MTSFFIAMVLLAAPPLPKPIVEPAPAAEFKRLQPRHVSASSVLRDSFYRFEQNYLPLYVADDAPATAWVEGVPGQGVGQSLLWQGPQLEKARAFKLFIRNGLQASKKLFEANSRVRKLKIEPLLIAIDGTTIKPAGAPLEVELQSVQGWQEIDLPTEATVSGVRLTILSTYKGTRYEDTCLSDVRVYVSGDDAWNGAVENKALEEIRAFIASRDQLKPLLASTYDGKKLGEGKPGASCGWFEECLRAFDDMATLAPAVERSRRALERAGKAVDDDMPAGWTFIDELHGSGASPLRSIFSTIYMGGEVAPNDLFDRHSLKLNPVPRPHRSDLMSWYGQDMILGPATAPVAVMVRSPMVIDGRTSTSISEGARWIVTYAGDLAEAVIDVDHRVIYLTQWSSGEGPPKLESIITLDLSGTPSIYQWVVKPS